MKSHPTDLVSFIPGIACVAIAVVALAGGLTLDVLATEWVWPTVLITLGTLVLATAGMGRRRAPEDQPDDQPSAPSESDEAPVDEAV